MLADHTRHSSPGASHRGRRPSGARPLLVRLALVVVAAAAWSVSAPLRAAPAAALGAKSDLAAFDAGFRAGQDRFNHGQFLDAARTWTDAAALLPETPEHRDNRVAIHEYIAQAYQKAIDNGASEAVLREAATVLDAYAQGFFSAYPGVPLPAAVDTTRDALLAAVAALDAEHDEKAVVEKPPPGEPPEPRAIAPEQPDREPPPPPPPVKKPRRAPPPKPWKGLAIGGSVTLAGGAAMAAMFGAGYALVKQREREFDASANHCVLSDPTGECDDIDDAARRWDVVATVAVIAAPVLLVSGATMLGIAGKRRAARPRRLAPILTPTTAGLMWSQRF